MSKTGQEIMSYCTSCRMDLAHTIVSMVGDRASKVECRTCKKTHQYRAPKGIDTPAAKKTRARSTKKTVSLEEEWKKMIDENPNSPKNYSVRQGFEIGDLLDHQTFGQGVVSKTIHPNKIEVVFQNDIKVLVHGK